MTATADLLATIVAATRRIVDVRGEREPIAELEKRAAESPSRVGRFQTALGRLDRINVIADHVRRQNFAGDPLGVATLQKMALAPEGAEALTSSAWFIPAVALRENDAVVIVLPGPPRELELVFRDAVEPGFLEGGAVLWREEIEHRFPESALAVVLTELERDFPGVKIGSYPLEDRVLIRLAGEEDEVREVARRVRSSIDELASSDDGRRLMEFMNARRSGGNS